MDDLIWEASMTVAEVFMAGESQAVRLPDEFRLAAKEVEIFRQGDDIVLRPLRKGLAHVVDLIRQLPEDMFDDIRDVRPPVDRTGL